MKEVPWRCKHQWEHIANCHWACCAIYVCNKCDLTTVGAPRQEKDE